MQRARGAAIECRRCGHANRPAVRFCTHCGLATARSRFPARETAVVVATILLTVALAAYQLSSDHSAAVRPAGIETPEAEVATLDAATFDAVVDARTAEAPEPPAAGTTPAGGEAAEAEAADGGAADGGAAETEAIDEEPANERALDDETAGQTAADEGARSVPEPLAASTPTASPGSSDVLVPRAGVDPLLDPLDAPRSLPPAAELPAAGATTKAELAEPRRARPPASIPPPASARAPERSEAPERTTKRVVVPSGRASRDWYRELRSALAACDGDPLLARIVCQESAKLRHCAPANAWGQVAECPRARVPDATTFN